MEDILLVYVYVCVYATHMYVRVYACVCPRRAETREIKKLTVMYVMRTHVRYELHTYVHNTTSIHMCTTLHVYICAQHT